jgi:hypothetical protein
MRHDLNGMAHRKSDHHAQIESEWNRLEGSGWAKKALPVTTLEGLEKRQLLILELLSDHE